MELADDIASWKVKELRDWLDRENINYSKTAKKQELIDLAVDAVQNGAVVERIVPETEVSRLTIDGLIQWLTNRNVELPTARQKKQFYLDLVESMSHTVDSDSPHSPSAPERSKQPPSTTPRANRSNLKKTPLRTKSSSPPIRRRSARRKLLDMPESSSSNEDDEDTTETDLAQAAASPAAVASSTSSTNRSSPGSVVILFLIFVVISAYIAYLTKSLITHLNW